MFKVVLSLLFSFNVFASVLAPTPNSQLTKGSVCEQSDEDFDGIRYPSKVIHCHRNVSYETKSQVYAAYGISDQCRQYYTIDHFIPLAIGGSNDLINLWPEHKAVKATRAKLEDDLYNALRRGEITQEAAIDRVIYEKTHATPVQVEDCR